MDNQAKSISRRSLLRAAAAGAFAAAPLSGCGSASTHGSASATRTGTLAEVMPAYVPSSLVRPDIPGVHGGDPAYLSYPTELVKTVPQIPGAGSSFDTITPLWSTIPAAQGNRYYAAVNRALGASVKLAPSDGTTYLGTMTKMFASGTLPDWVNIPSWGEWPQTIGLATALGQKCADLTPYLSGSNVRNYPNLANVPSNAWQAGIWGGKLYGIPVYPSNIALSGSLFYRKDLFAAKGLAEPKSADELFALGKELTDAKAQRWAFDDCWSCVAQPFDIPTGWTTDDKGGLAYKYELDRFAAALEFFAKVFSAGYVHPDAVAGKTSDAKKRFTSGAVAIYGDGTGAWGEMVSAQAGAGNTAFRMQAMAPFSANGRDKPKYVLSNGAGLFSYLNKNLTKAKIEEVLRIANYIAAPYGSLEYTLVNYGELNLHHTMETTGPKLTAAGSAEIASTYQFLATAPTVTAMPGYPEWVKAFTAWQGNAAQYTYKPLFFGLNIAEPTQYAKINDPVEAVVVNVLRGKQTMADFRSAVATWRQHGGDALRAFYTKVREENGAGS